MIKGRDLRRAIVNWLMVITAIAVVWFFVYVMIVVMGDLGIAS
jgi:hypothetical protein